MINRQILLPFLSLDLDGTSIIPVHIQSPLELYRRQKVFLNNTCFSPTHMNVLYTTVNVSSMQCQLSIVSTRPHANRYSPQTTHKSPHYHTLPNTHSNPSSPPHTPTLPPHHTLQPFLPTTHSNPTSPPHTPTLPPHHTL